MAAVISRTSRPSTALIFGLKSHAVPIVRALPSAVSFGALGVLSSPRSRPLQSGNPLLPSQFPMGNRRPRSGEADAGPSKAQKVEGSSTDYAPDPDEAVRMLDYINKSWSAYHAVGESLHPSTMLAPLRRGTSSIPCMKSRDLL